MRTTSVASLSHSSEKKRRARGHCNTLRGRRSASAPSRGSVREMGARGDCKKHVSHSKIEFCRFMVEIVEPPIYRCIYLVQISALKLILDIILCTNFGVKYRFKINLLLKRLAWMLR